MSLYYGYIFSQIDKAKKKRKRWTQADTDAAAKKLAEEKEARGPVVSQRRYRRNPGGKNKPETHRSGTGGSFKKEKPLPKQGGKDAGPQAAHSSSIVEGKTSESRTRNKVPFKGEKRIADVGTEDEGKIHRGTDRKGLPRNFQREKEKREEAKEKKEQQEKDEKETFTGKPHDFPKGHSTQKPTTHRRYRTVIDAKGNKVSVPVTMKPSDTKQKNPASRRGQLRTESGAYSIKDPVEANRRLAEADRKYTKERKEPSLQSYMDYLKDKEPKKKKKKKEDGTEASDDDFEPDYSSLVSDDDDDIGPIGKSLWKSWLEKKDCPNCGKKIKKKKRKLLWNFITQPPDIYPSEIDGIGENTEEDEVEKSLWKSWLKNKVSMSRMKPPKNTKQEEEKKMEEKMRGRQKLREGTFVPGKRVPGKYQTSGVKDVETREGESYEKFRKRQDAVEDPREHKTLIQQLDDMGVLNQNVESAPEPVTSAPTPKPTTSTPTAKPADDDDDWENPMASQKSLYKTWLKEKAEPERPCPSCGGKNVKDYDQTLSGLYGDPPEVEDYECKECGEHYSRATGEPRRKKEKAEEGIGGMNMGSQRGLGHDAGYKQDPGESAQITEVKEKTDKCPECKSKLVVPGEYKSSKEKRGHKIRYCDDCGHEWEKKSAYENHEQDESPDSQPNKQQIPPSKPGMDALKSYKKALIIKYNNIYKPANI